MQYSLSGIKHMMRDFIVIISKLAPTGVSLPFETWHQVFTKIWGELVEVVSSK